MNNKTTLLDLLNQNALITFESGYGFRGDKSTGYIDLVTPDGSDGIESLDKRGLNKAFIWKDLWETAKNERVA